MAKGKKSGGKNWEPGQSGNPKGSPGLPKDIKEARKLGQVELERVVNRYLYSTDEETAVVAADPGTMKFDRIVLAIIDQAISGGSPQHLDFLLNRVIGKVQDRVEVTLPKPFILHRSDGTKVELGAKLDKKDDE